MGASESESSKAEPVSQGDPLLRTIGLSKSYTVPVLSDFDFELRSGEVHALVGANGAGKSTFARILSGLTPPDAGQMELAGELYRPRSKSEAERLGVTMVLQELNLISTLTVAENLFLNRLPRRAGFVRFGHLEQQAREALAKVGLAQVDPWMPADKLGIGQQQLVEIAGALAQRCRVLILDEPTAALTDPEIERLFDNVRALQRQGIGIIYISHRMDEIRQLASRVTVLRDGRRIATHSAPVPAIDELVREMVGHTLPPRSMATRTRTDEVALRVSHLSSGERVQDVSFEAYRGEILGLAGLIGSGRTETLRAIFGAAPRDEGEIFLGRSGPAVSIRHPGDAVKLGIGMVPEDRKKDALLMSQSIRVNTTLATLAQHARAGGWLDQAAEAAVTQELGRRLGLKYDSLDQPVEQLSGGNQQKVVIARWLARDGDIFLFDEPTRGIDVAAKDSIYRLLGELAQAGRAVIVVSSELTELMAICDRILVLSAGRLAGEFLAGQWSQEKITEAAFKGYHGARQ